MAAPDDLLFLGTHGHVAAIRKASGRRVWTTSLPGTGYNIVSLLHEDGVLYAGAGGHVFALDAASGEVLWHNGLRGLGYGHMTLATTRASTDPAVLRAQLDAEEAAASD